MALVRGIQVVLARPFAAATWRELAYLLVGGAIAVVAFGEVVGMVTGSLVLLVAVLAYLREVA
jgi:hypothetical protein